MARHLAVLVLPLAACQCEEQPQLSRVVPVIELSAEAIEFGEVPVGATKRVLLRVDNAGTADLTVIAATTASPFGAERLHETIAPGGTGLVDVYFRPGNDAPQAGELRIESNDESNPMLVVALTGQGVAGLVTVQPSRVEFGDTTVGVARAVELVLTNFGLEPAVGRIVAERFDRPEHFAMTNLSDFTSTGQYSVAPRGEAIADLTYRPLALGADAGRVVFEVCGERCGLEVDVTGTGSEAAVRLNPTVLDFGTLGIGDVATQQLLVENIGNSPLSVVSATGMGGASLQVSSTRSLPFTLEPNASLALNVELTAVAAGDIMGSVVVRTTDPLVPEARAAVVAEGQGPLFSVQPAAVAFGVVRDPVTYTRPILLLNSGSTVVAVEAVTISGDPELALGPLPGLPATLAAGESLIVNVEFSPTQIREYAASVTIESDDPATAQVVVPVTGGMADQICELVSSPPSINFGVLPPGFVRSATAQITNVGQDACEITSGAFRAPVDPAITLVNAPWPVTLAPGATEVLEFVFAPSDMVESKANLTMQTTDPVFPERHLALAGTGLGYVDIFTSPTSVDFGEVAPSCQLPARTVTLYNSGTVGADVTSIVLTSSTTELSLTAVPSTPFRLQAGGSQSFEVSYLPVDFGRDTGEVEITVDGLVFPLVVPLLGEGSQRPRNEEVFQQPVVDKVDVLFVIDDSCSMADDQQALAQNFASFIQRANVRQVDFHIGITTTTLHPSPGAFVGPVMNRNTPRLESVFSSQANVGTGGSGFEQGLDAMAAAFWAAAAGQGHNAGFLRPDAIRSVVIVSDEDDQSLSQVPFYWQELVSHAPAGFSTVLITGGPTGCSRMGRSAYAAPKYEDFARVTSGLALLICDDWANTLANAGNAVFGLRNVFTLARPADTMEPIEVYVDGVPQASGWMYDPNLGAVVFNAPPAAGATVRIVYTPVC